MDHGLLKPHSVTYFNHKLRDLALLMSSEKGQVSVRILPVPCVGAADGYLDLRVEPHEVIWALSVNPLID